LPWGSKCPGKVKKRMGNENRPASPPFISATGSFSRRQQSESVLSISEKQLVALDDSPGSSVTTPPLTTEKGYLSMWVSYLPVTSVRKSNLSFKEAAGE